MKYSAIQMPQDVEFILNTLEESGHEAFIVGGCVRDSILGRIPGDWDITTSAAPQQVKNLFEKTYDTGIRHGTVTVLLKSRTYEITTYRIEGEYNDFRRPSSVTFSDNIIEDLQRRDFTVNAIAYASKRGYVDPFGGLADIEGKVLRCVGKAEERFREDALRMLRAVRFSAQLDFQIEDATFQAIKNCSDLIQKISSERIREELTKLLLSEHPGQLILLKDCKLLSKLLPEFEKCMETGQANPYHIYNVGIHTIKTIENIERDLVLRWTMLLHDTGKPWTKTTDEKGIDHFYRHELKSCEIAENVLKRLRFDNKTIDRILRLVRWHDRPVEPSQRAVRRAIRTIGEDIFLDLLKVKRADIKSQNPEFGEERLKKLDQVERLYREVKELNQCVSRQGLAVDGKDLVNLGCKEGKQVGILLEKLLDLVVEQPEMNDRESLLAEAKKMV